MLVQMQIDSGFSNIRTFSTLFNITSENNEVIVEVPNENIDYIGFQATKDVNIYITLYPKNRILEDTAEWSQVVSGQQNIGVVQRLSVGEDLELIIQDNLTTITKLEVVAEGHIVV